MSFKITKENYKRFLLMLFSVLLMGFSLSILVLTNFGTDPCSAMNYGISRHIGMSFGTYQMLLNVVLLIFVIIFDRSLIGWGTLGNMILVGYTADFCSWFWHNICHIPDTLPFAVRIGILIPGLIVFVFSAASYMQSGQGMAPYDGIPFIISNKIKERTGKDRFKIVRLSLDLLGTVLGLITGGETGLMTWLMVITLAPTVEFVGKIFHKQDSN